MAGLVGDRAPVFAAFVEGSSKRLLDGLAEGVILAPEESGIAAEQKSNGKYRINENSRRERVMRMPVLSTFARRKKISYFLSDLPSDARILEIGSADGWVGAYLRARGFRNYTGLDIVPPADVIGDVRMWRKLGLGRGSFDVIVMFEVLEHVDCVSECLELLRPGGKLLVTTPLPSRDWVLRLLEHCGLTQRRTSPHTNLVDLHQLEGFQRRRIRCVAGLAQWGVFEK